MKKMVAGFCSLVSFACDAPFIVRFAVRLCAGGCQQFVEVMVGREIKHKCSSSIQRRRIIDE